MFDASDSARFIKIAENLSYLKSLSTPFYLDPSFLGAIIASVVALSIALFGEPLRKIWSNSKISPLDVDRKEQMSGTRTCYRIVLKNLGNTTARDVEIYVVKLIENSIERVNFLPVPLKWTHARAYMNAGVYRDIHPKQVVYADLCDLNPSMNRLKLALSAGDEVEDFSIINNFPTKLVLEVYKEEGGKEVIKINIEGEIQSPSIRIED